MRISQMVICMLALVPTLAIACDSQDDILRAALTQIDADGHFDTIVLRPNLSSQSRQAASHLRATIEQSSLTPAVDQQLPNNYFLLDRIEVTENTATVYGTVGAILRPDPKNLFACGTGYVIGLLRNSSGQWVPDKFFASSC